MGKLLLEMATILLLIIVPLSMAEGLVEIRTSNMTSTLEGDTCVCKVFTGWSELAEYTNLNEMRVRLRNTQKLIHFMNFTAIFEQFNNFTGRLNNLEDHINKQAVATSVTELFALRKRIDQVLNLVEQTSSSAFVQEQKTRMEKELTTISKAVDGIWSRNPYKQREDYKREVEELREQYSNCNKVADMSVFKGDALPLTLPPSEGWCPKELKPLRLGNPTTHKWEHGSYSSSGMWFKDPEPLTNASKTAFWEIKRNSNNYYNWYTYSTYATFLSDAHSATSTTGQYRSRGRFLVRGYGAIIYKNKLYYNYESYLKKLDLNSKVSSSVVVGFRSVNYKGSSGSTFLDLKVDELGLWLIYSMSSDNKIAISRIDPETLIMTKTWMTDVVKTDICGAFMVCGQMYTVRSCSTRVAPTTPNYVYDTRTSLGKYLQFHVPSKYGSISQLTYNPRERLLFAWDNGHLVTYNLGWQVRP